MHGLAVFAVVVGSALMGVGVEFNGVQFVRGMVAMAAFMLGVGTVVKMGVR